MRKRILIVDDDPNFLDMMRDEFSRNGWQVYLAASGSDALEKFAVFMPDVLTLDILMPGLDGFKTIELIRKYIRGHNYLLFFLTYIHDSQTKIKSLKTYHPADYLDKALFGNNVSLIYWSISKKYDLLSRHRRVEDNSWTEIDSADIGALLSIRIYSGFTGVIKIECEDADCNFRFQHGTPVLVEVNGANYEEIDDVLEILGRKNNCRLKVIGESEVKDMLRRRLNLMFESINSVLNLPAKIAVVDAYERWIVSNFRSSSTEGMVSFASSAGNILSRLSSMRYTNSDYMLFRTDLNAIIVVQITENNYLVIAIDKNIFSRIKPRLMAMLRSKINSFRMILREKAVT